MGQTLEGRTVLVTGAAGGFGRVLTAAFLKAGANVTAADIAPKGLEALKAFLDSSGLGDRCLIRALDISDAAACQAVVDEARAHFGGLDVLINNGAMGMGVFREDHMTNLVGIEEIEPETWDRFIQTNLSGAWYLTRAVVPGMKAAGWGRIITVTTSFFTMLRGRFHPYGPSKAALEAMSAGHAAEFADDGITVNVVVPGGPADTPMVPEAAGFKRSDLVSPDKMVAPMLWLASTAADGVTGKRYVAAHWDASRPVAEARTAAEAPIGWPGLAAAPVWPGGNPDA
jgi:NAD(P)-dependent dehydrogenase (short-subunit alcohol dehydrogenase family)